MTGRPSRSEQLKSSSRRWSSRVFRRAQAHQLALQTMVPRSLSPEYRQFLVLIYVDLDNDATTVNCSVWIKGGAAEPGIQDYVELSPTGHHSWRFFIGHRNCVLANTGH